VSIVPSNKLRVVSVHKLKDISCFRRYYWRWILNLQTRATNLNFWYGGVLGAGFEAMLMGEDWQAEMLAEHARRTVTQSIPEETRAEMDLQYRLIEVLLEGGQRRPEVAEMRLEVTQVPVRLRLEHSGVLYCGTADGKGRYRGKPSMYEIKTAARVNAAYLDALAFDPQLYSYAMTPAFKGITSCCYGIFMKPQKRVKRKQTIDEFVEEIRQDCVDRPNVYYQFHTVPLGRSVMKANRADVENATEILQRRYDYLGDQLHAPDRWPKCPNKCFEYSGCEFLPLCKNAGSWEYYLRLYRQRDFLYEEEKAELVEPVGGIVRKKVKRKMVKKVKKTKKAKRGGQKE